MRIQQGLPRLLLCLTLPIGLLLTGCGNMSEPVRSDNLEAGKTLPAAEFSSCNEPTTNGAVNSTVARYRKAAEQGDATAQKELGLLYYHGQCVPKNHAEAAIWFSKAAVQGLASAQYNLGFLFRNGYGVYKHYITAYLWYSLAAAQENASAKRELTALESEMTRLQIAQAQRVSLAWTTAERGDAEAQFIRGTVYSRGFAVQQDYAEAARWFRKSAEQGYAVAQNALGLAYYHGKGVPQDCSEALQWFQKAADQKQVNAQTTLGWFYYKGICLSEDFPKALEWNHLAAAQGFTEAQSNLGEIYESGSGVPKNNSEALKWYRLAAERNNASGQINLGHMYATGKGVKRDYVTAYLWTALAAKHDKAHVPNEQVLERAKDALNELISKMTYAEITEGQKQANAWKQTIGITTGTTGANSGTTDATNGEKARPSAGTNNQPSISLSIPLKTIGSLYSVPVLINNTLTLDFVIENSGTNVAIPADVVLTLFRSGTIHEADFIGTKTVTLADGSTMPSEIFHLRSLQVGTMVLNDVTANIAPVKSFLLLGQGLLDRFGAWTIDNSIPALILYNKP